MSCSPYESQTSLHWNVELTGISTCQKCGRALDGCAQGVLGARAEKIMTRAVRELAALQGICGICESLAARMQHAAPFLHLSNQRRVELSEYFSAAPARVIGNAKLREPQVESVRAIREYFGNDRHKQRPQLRHALPAIVEIPTGCGKTGIICAAPFGVAAGRVLVVTPNLTIKRNLVKSLAAVDENGDFNRDNFYLKSGIFDAPEFLPKFVVLESGLVNLEDCLRADYVVANVQQLQNWLRRLEPDFFDMIIVDEAHHEPADSWQRVNDAFPEAKKIYLTATPFRCDGKMIVGETIYRYRLAHAIQNRYVKNVMKADAVASRMTFTLDGESREFAYEEIMAMREELWFSKGVALSPVCNATIVERSIAIWKKKSESGVPHQIIGAACSIRHAVQIVELFRERGVKSTHVASEGMSFEERTSRIRAYENGDFDCMVHVGILGEGYDNPNISVAAIFRPYRSISPYVQFVGRTLRWIAAAANSFDNLAHVVSHSGLNLNYLWEYFKHESREAAILSYIDQLFFDDEARPDGFDWEMPELEFESEETGTDVTGEEIEGWDVDVFLQVENLDVSCIGGITSRLDAFRATMDGDAFRAMERRHEIARREQTFHARGGVSTSAPHSPRGAFKLKRSDESTLPLPFHRPDLERRASRKKLHKEILRAAGVLVSKLRLSPAALHEVLAREGEKNYGNNYEAIVRSVNRRVNELMNKERSASNRNDWTLDEIEDARGLVAQARGEVLSELRRAIIEREQKLLPLE
jgi:DNA repair protein RadD